MPPCPPRWWCSGGHLDSKRTNADNTLSTTLAPGADDNASGVAALSEALRVLLANGFVPDRTVKFMGYAAEEVGLLGSGDIAAAHLAAGTNVVGVMQFDMTDYNGSIEDIVFISDNTNAALTAFVADLVETYQPELQWTTTACGYACSDHASWHNRGYPAVFPFEARFGQHNQTIHTANDTLATLGNATDHALKFAKVAVSFAVEAGSGSSCSVNGDCDDGLFCNGAETCDPVFGCQAGSNPCGSGTCDEANDTCVGSSPVLWVSFKADTAVPGVGTVANEDVVGHDEGSGIWSLVFDGSDVGLGALEIDGLAALPSGELLLSFTTAATISGISVDDSDVVRFTPSSLGAATAGSFSMYFDGSDVGLTTNGEDVDAIAIAADGRLIVSVLDAFSANGASGVDEDLFIFTGTLGTTTSGSFALFFDGSDVGLDTSTNEDLDAAALTDAGQLLFSTLGSFSVTGLAGDNEDVGQFTGTFGSTTTGSFTMRRDLSTLGIATSADVGELHLVE
ncbi:MAG: M20/M25/M40 family metallo-hydrolase [Thermoanaerobaculia bacterium]|nr:M20/M25/M40 family metallo-hydrolase [Thermoanaerobaculia bacterium]